MAQGLGEQALADLSGRPPGQHVVKLEQFGVFVLGKRKNASKAHEHAAAESMHQTQDELLREQSLNEALNRTVESLSARSNNRGPFGWSLQNLMGLPHTLSSADF